MNEARGDRKRNNDTFSADVILFCKLVETSISASTFTLPECGQLKQYLWWM